MTAAATLLHNPRPENGKPKLIAWAETQRKYQYRGDGWELHVYADQSLKQMTVCKDEDLCSGAPTLPAFEMSANEIFLKPPKPV